MIRTVSALLPPMIGLSLLCCVIAQAQPAAGAEDRLGGEPLWVIDEVRAPGVHYGTFESTAVAGPVSYHVYLPEAYHAAALHADAETRFPTVYWLHGGRGQTAAHIRHVAAHFADAMRAGKMPPMIVVFPNAPAHSLWSDSRDGRMPVETMMIGELLPHIDATFRTIASREGRIVEGFSMGGYGAARFGLRYPDLFGAASSLAGGNPWALAEQNSDAIRGRLLLRVGIGSEDERLAAAREFTGHLDRLGIPHEFVIVPDAGHEPMVVLRGLGDEGWAFYREAVATAGESAESADGSRWITEGVEAPGVEQRAFDSEAVGGPVSYHVYLPDEYDDEPERRFPVLYWLHGSGGFSAVGVRSVSAHFRDAMRAGSIPPMIVIFPHAPAMSLWVDSKDGRLPLETMIVAELLPHVDETLRTVASGEGRIVEGWSSGGYGAARFGLKFPELFGAASSLAGGPLQEEFTHSPRTSDGGRTLVLRRVFGGDHEYFRALSPWRLAEENAEAVRGRLRFRVVIGDQDEMIEVAHQFHARLEELAIPHTFTVVPGVGHEPMRVLRALGEGGGAFYREALAGLAQVAPEE